MENEQRKTPTWSDVAQSPQFQQADEATRQAVRGKFFDAVVRPMTSEANFEAVQSQFLTMTEEDVFGKTPNSVKDGENKEVPGAISNSARNLGERTLDLAGNTLRAADTLANRGEEALTEKTGINPGLMFGTTDRLSEAGYEPDVEFGLPFTDKRFGFDATMNANPDDTEIGVGRAGKAVADTTLGYVPDNTIDKALDDPSLKTVGGAILEQGPAALADMAGLYISMPAYLLSRNEEIARSRAGNQGREGEMPSLNDLAYSTPATAASVAIDKLALSKLLPGANKALTSLKQVPGRAAKGMVAEGGTEAVQEHLEYAGETVNTETGYDLGTGMRRSAGGALIGAPLGGGVAGVSGVVEASRNTADAPDTAPSEAPVVNDQGTPDEQVVTAAGDLLRTPRSKLTDIEREARDSLIEGDAFRALKQQATDLGLDDVATQLDDVAQRSAAIFEQETLARANGEDLPASAQQELDSVANDYQQAVDSLNQQAPKLSPEELQQQYEEAWAEQGVDVNEPVENREEIKITQPRGDKPRVRMNADGTPVGKVGLTVPEEVARDDAESGAVPTEPQGQAAPVGLDVGANPAASGLADTGTAPAAEPEPTPAVDPVAETVAEPATPKVARVPTQMTNKMRGQLKTLGYTPDEIKGLRPQQAWDAIEAGTPPTRAVIEEAGTQTNVDPTPAQAEAGNYQKGRVRLNGLEIAIENPKGSTRRGTDPDGTPWESPMVNHYGDIKRTTAADGDNLDVFVGDNPDSDQVFVIDQLDEAGQFDESKVMVGFRNATEARKAYLAHYPKGWKGLGMISKTDTNGLKGWIRDGDTTLPYGELTGQMRQNRADALKAADQKRRAEKAQQQAQETPKAEPKQTPTPRASGREAASQTLSGATTGDTITLAENVGYAKAGEAYTIYGITKDGEVSIRNKKGAGTTLSKSELARIRRSGKAPTVVERGLVYAPGKKPFTTEKGAKISKAYRDTPGATVEPVEGGFAVRPPLPDQTPVKHPSNNESRSRLGAKGRLTKRDVEAAIQPLAAQGIRAEVVDSVDHLPTSLRRNIERDGVADRLSGAYHNGVAYLIAPNLTSDAEATKTVLHEVVGHAGVNKVLGNDLAPTMRQIYRDMPATQKARLEQTYRSALDNQPTDRRQQIVAEEYVAHLAETDPRSTVLDRVVAKVREWLRKAFGEQAAKQWGRKEIIDLLAQSRKAVDARSPAQKRAAEASRYKLRFTQTVGGYKANVQPDGTLTLKGDPAEIRAKLPDTVKGRVVEDGLRFTPNAAPQVRNALAGRRNAFSRGGEVTKKLAMRNGTYVGAPARFNTPGKITKLRRNLSQLAEEGAVGRYWYENSGKAVLRMVGGDVHKARQFVALLAIYSPQANVDSNGTFALRAWAQHEAGLPIKVRTEVQDAKAEAALKNVEEFWSGEKTGNFFFNLLREIDPATEGQQGATIDMWMMRAAQYDHDAPTNSEYSFMENEANRIAQEMGWEPQQVQAAIWVGMKARMENPSVKKRTEAVSEKRGLIHYKDVEKNGRVTKQRVVPKATERAHLLNWIDQAMKSELTAKDTMQAKFDFADAIARHIGQVSWEARPGRTSGVLPGANDAPYDQQVEFQQAVHDALRDENGVDLLAAKLGLISEPSDLMAPGAWQGEVSAGMQKLVAIAPDKGGNQSGTVDPAIAEAMDAYVNVLGLLTYQEGVGWHRPFAATSKKSADAMDVDIGRSLTADEMLGVSDALDAHFTEAGQADWQDSMALVSTPQGVRLLNMGAVKDGNALEALDAVIAPVLPDHTTGLMRFSGGFGANNWQENPDGQDYKTWFDSAGRSDLLDWAGSQLQPRIQRVFNDFSERYGWGDPGSDRYKLTGDGSGRPEGGRFAPLEGAPSVRGFEGPDPKLVNVAERYAERAGIPLRRQARYVKVDPDRAEQIAAAYDAMEHAPQDPAVREAYQNLIDQTMAQYKALSEAGYQFWFIDLDQPSNEAYAASPWNAMRDIRATRTMGVFPTADGFGSSDLDVSTNPLLEDTGLTWPVGGPDSDTRAPVTANDVFRAVHDAFGHGLEGAGFRADGEENAWQAHARLFTGSALGALTSETRGQNSWLNYGPYGETNRTAPIEDTVFADQKTGLMPEWTWTEGRAGDMETDMQADETLPPGSIVPVHAAENSDKLASLVAAFEEAGEFTAPPILVYRDDSGANIALTGSHRWAAADQADVDIPVIYTKDGLGDFESDYGMDINDVIGRGDEDVARLLRAFGDERSASVMDAEVDANVRDDSEPRYSLNDSTGFGLPDDRLRDVALRKIADKFAPLKKLQQSITASGGNVNEDNNVYLAEEAFHGKAETDIDNLRDNHVEPLGEALAKNNVTTEQFDDFLRAKHAEERNAHIAEISDGEITAGSGMTNERADEILAEHDRKGTRNMMEAMADRVYRMLEIKRQALRDAGLETDETLDAWQAGYRWYVPLKGWANDEDVPAGKDNKGRMRTGKGFEAGSGTKAAMGRSTKSASPMLTAIADTTEALIQRRKNEVAQALLSLVSDNPNPALWQVFTDSNPDTGPGLVQRTDPETGQKVTKRVNDAPVNMRMSDDYFRVKKNGATFYIKMNDARLLDAMRTVGPETNWLITRVLGSITRVMSALVTSYNPEFMVTNFARDVQTAMYNITAERTRDDGRLKDIEANTSKFVWQVGKDMRHAYRAAYRGGARRGGKNAPSQQWDAWYKEFREAGAKTGYFDMKDLDGQAKELRSIMMRTKGGGLGNLIRARKATADFVENTNSAVENAVRLSTYVNARKQGLSKRQAASLAKNLTVNFNRRGELGTGINALYMFANASIQGTMNFSRAMVTIKDTPDGKSQYNVWARANLAQKLGLGIMGSTYLMATVNRMLSDEDDDGVLFYDKIPGYVKERNFIIMTGPKDYIKIPMPYGYNVFGVLGTHFEALQAGTTSAGEMAKHTALAVLGSFSPIGFEDSEDTSNLIAKNLSPTVIRSLTQIVTNEDFAARPVYKEDFAFGTPTPDSSRSFRSTPEPYKALASFLNEFTGGSQWREGAIDVSPDVLQHLVNYYGGGAWGFAEKTTDLAKRLVTGEEIEKHRVPFSGRFMSDINEYGDIQNFYKRRDEVGQLAKEFEEMNPDGAPEFYEEYGAKIDLFDTATEIEKTLTELRKAKDEIEAADEIDRERKDKLVKEIEEAMDTEVDLFNRWYLEAEEQMSQ